MPLLYPKDGGMPVPFEPDEIEAALATGLYNRPDSIPVVGKYGEVGEIPYEDLERERQIFGGRVATGAEAEEQRFKQRVEDKYGGLVGSALTTVGSAADTALMGIPSLLLDDETAREWKEIKEQHGAADIIGQVGGLVTPGGLAGKATKGVIGFGKGIGGKAGAAAAIAGEGALGGFVEGVQQVGLADEPVKIEQALSDIGASTVLGTAAAGVAGVGGAALGGLMRRASKGLRSKADDLAKAPAQGSQIVEQAAAYEEGVSRSFLVIGDKTERGGIGKPLNRIRRQLERPETTARNPRKLFGELEDQGRVLDNLASKPKEQILEEMAKADTEVVAGVGKLIKKAGKATKPKTPTQKAKLQKDIQAAESKLADLRAKRDGKIAEQEQAFKASGERLSARAEKSIRKAEDSVKAAQDDLERAVTERAKRTAAKKLDRRQKLLEDARADAWREARLLSEAGDIKAKNVKDDWLRREKVFTKQIDDIQAKIDELEDFVVEASADEGKVTLPRFEAAMYRDWKGVQIGKPVKGTGKVTIDVDEAQRFIDGLDAGDMTAIRSEVADEIPLLAAQNQAIRDGIDAFYMKPAKGLADDLSQMAKIYATTAATGLVPGGPLGGAIAYGAARIADKAGRLITGKMSMASAEAAEKAADIIESVMKGGSKIGPTLPRASAALATTFLGDEDDEVETEPVPRKRSSGGDLVANYRKREKELRRMTVASMSGAFTVRDEIRRRVSANLEVLRMYDPRLADKAEAVLLRKMSWLASQLPKRPDVAGKYWHPPLSDIRSFARKVAAVERPMGVLKRVAAGTVTPEDAEAFKATNPEWHASIVRDVIMRMDEARELPPKGRLALSIFTGLPIDPGLHPPVLRQLQSSYAAEPGSQAGTQNPVPQPQFGSVRKSTPEPTPAQRRQSGETI